MSVVMSAMVRSGEVIPVRIECQVHRRAIPQLIVTGLARGSVSESRERISSTLRSLGVSIPRARIVVNLQPTDIPKQGSLLDLPIVIAILQAIGRMPDQARVFAAGEVSLSGELVAHPEAFAILRAGLGFGEPLEAFYVPVTTPFITALPSLERVIPVNHVRELLEGQFPQFQNVRHTVVAPDSHSVRALEWRWVPATLLQDLSLVLAGHHHLLLFGSPGYGKTHAQQVTRALWPSEDGPVWSDRAERASRAGYDTFFLRLIEIGPSVTRTGMHGSTKSHDGYPGLLWQARGGIAWCEELGLWPLAQIESLRAPLETHSGRFIATLNPCPCGYAGEARCQWDQATVKRYQRRISLAVLDRFMLIRRFEPPASADMAASAALCAQWQRRIQRAWKRQDQRLLAGFPATNHAYGWEHSTPDSDSLRRTWHDRLAAWSPRRRLAWWRVLQTLADLSSDGSATETLVQEAYVATRPLVHWG